MDNQTNFYDPVQPAGMAAPKPQIDMAAKKKRAGKFCFISLGFFAAGILTGLAWAKFGSNSTALLQALQQIMFFLIFAFYFAAVAFMIVARIKCRQSKFGLTLMWVYIAVFAIALISFLVLIGILAFSIGMISK